MWSFAVVIIVAFLIRADFGRSGLCWRDFVILRFAWVYSRLWHRWTGPRPKHWPGQGACLVVANHTCSADPAFLLAASTRGIGFLVAAEHYNVHPILRDILDHLGCVPVRRHGRDWLAVRKTLRRLREGRAVCLFPEGNLSGVPSNRLLRAKQGAAYLALKSRVPIYPAHIAGGPRTEELLHSWVIPSPRAVRVTFGEAIDLSQFHGRPITRDLIEEVTVLLMAGVQALGEQHARGRKSRA